MERAMAYHMNIDGRDIEITHPDKQLFPGITKKEFVTYYHNVAPLMLPYIQHRPVTMRRFPGGITEDGFYHKDIPDHFPEWIQRETIKKKSGGTTTYVICHDAASLVYVANYDCITPHVWLSTIEHIKRPDRLIFDLDPTQEDIPLLKETALQLRDLLTSCGLTPYIMTTGSRGFHIVVPIQPDASFDTARSYASRVTEYMAEQNPHTVTTALRKEKREGRIFLDINRIAYGQTGVAAYAVRAREDAPVATPIRWDELQRDELHPRSYTIANILRRMGQMEDPWKDMMHHQASVSRAEKQLHV